MKKQFNLVKLVRLSLLAAVSYVLMFFSFPIIPFAPFLKLDLSDLPILIGTVLFGPLAGIVITLIKVLLYWITFGASLPSLIGLIASASASIAILLPVYYGTRSWQNRSNWLRALFLIVIETLCLTLVLSVLNFFVITPLYMNLMGLKIGMPIAQYVLTFIVPFNFLKGIIVGVLFVIINDQLIKRL